MPLPTDSPTRSLIVLPTKNDNKVTVIVEQTEDAMGVSVESSPGDLIDYQENRSTTAVLENSTVAKGDKISLTRDGGSTSWTVATYEVKGTWVMEAS